MKSMVDIELNRQPLNPGRPFASGRSFASNLCQIDQDIAPSLHLLATGTGAEPEDRDYNSIDDRGTDR